MPQFLPVNVTGIDGLTTASAANPFPVAAVPATSTAIAPVVSTALEASHVLKASAGTFYGGDAYAASVPGYVMLFDSATVPADGAVTPLKSWPIAASAGIAVGYNPPIACANGIVVVFSTTGPFTKTVSATAFFSMTVA